MKFIHLTDLHLVSPGDQLKGLDPVARLEPAFASWGHASWGQVFASWGQVFDFETPRHRVMGSGL